MNSKCLLKIYYAHIYSLLSYCIMLYGNHCLSNMRILERFQTRILKLIFRVSSDEIDETRTKYKLFNMSQLFKYKVICLAHLIVHDNDKTPFYFKHMYKSKLNTSLRNRYNFISPFYRTSIGQRTLDVVIGIEWNQLPANIKNITNRKIFKTTLKNYLLFK